MHSQYELGAARQGRGLVGTLKECVLVTHVTGRGGGSAHHDGPVLMAWATVENIADFTRYGSNHIKALYLVTGLVKTRDRPHSGSECASTGAPTVPGSGVKTPAAPPLPERSSAATRCSGH